VETCGANPVQEARKLKQAGIKLTTDVVGFDVAKPDEARRLRAIAQASGGTYSDARTANALQDVFDQASCGWRLGRRSPAAAARR